MLLPKVKLLKLNHSYQKTKREIHATSGDTKELYQKINVNIQQLKELSLLVKLEKQYPNKIRANLIWNSWAKAWKTYSKLVTLQTKLDAGNLEISQVKKIAKKKDSLIRDFSRQYGRVNLFLNWYVPIHFSNKVYRKTVHLHPATSVESSFWGAPTIY